MREARPQPLVFALFGALVLLGLQSLRWWFVMRPVLHLRYAQAFKAMMVGFLFNALLRYTPVWVAAVLSGLLFGASHLSLSALAPLAASGIVLAYVYHASGSLTASMLTHALFNALNMVALASGHT